MVQKGVCNMQDLAEEELGRVQSILPLALCAQL